MSEQVVSAESTTPPEASSGPVDSNEQVGPRRRDAIVAVGALGAVVVVGAVVATGASGDAAPDDDEERTGTQPGGTRRTATVPRAEIPIGGALVLPDGPRGPIVVAQPEQEEFVAFTGTCTHRGCTVEARGMQLRCPCHGSVFDAATGENLIGPAPDPLTALEVSLDDQGAVVVTLRSEA